MTGRLFLEPDWADKLIGSSSSVTTSGSGAETFLAVGVAMVGASSVEGVLQGVGQMHHAVVDFGLWHP